MLRFFEPANQDLAEDELTPEQLRAENEAILQQVGRNLPAAEFEKLKRYLNALVEEIIKLQEHRDRLREGAINQSAAQGANTDPNSAKNLSNTPG